MITEIIDKLTDIIRYFASGFAFLWLFNKLRAKKDVDITLLLVGSAIVSYFIKDSVYVVAKKIVKPIVAYFFPEFATSLKLELLLQYEVLVCVPIAIALALLLYWLYNREIVSKIFSKLTNKSINDDIWRDVIDKKATSVNVFLKNKTILYTGKLRKREENGMDSWFQLVEYTCTHFNEDGTAKEKFFDSSSYNKPTSVMIPLSEIERIELIYRTDTKILD